MALSLTLLVADKQITSLATTFFGVKFLRRFFADTKPLLAVAIFFVVLVSVAVVGIIIDDSTSAVDVVALILEALQQFIWIFTSRFGDAEDGGRIQDECVIVSEEMPQIAGLRSVRFTKLSLILSSLLLLLSMNFGAMVEAELVT